MKTKPATLHARFYSLLSRLPRANKETLVWRYSNTVTTSLSELYQRFPQAYRQMIADMQRMADSTQTQAHELSELRKRRSAILLRLQRIGIDTTSWNAVNSYMRSPKIAGKTLGELTCDEMDCLIPKLESILRKERSKCLTKTKISLN